jgi:1-acyl-sn-glycerol-3-phosphate acyltransferase
MALRARLKWVAIWYWFWIGVARVLQFLLLRWSVSGREHMPETGPVIVVCNHLSAADPPLFAAAFRRRIIYMAKIEAFQHTFSFMVRWYGAFPVRRFEADMTALLNAERVLRRGEVLGMFPEGTRSKTGALGKPRPGTALIALRAGAPVLPCVIYGTDQLRNPLVLLRRPRMGVIVGRPIPVDAARRPTQAQVDELTEQIFEAMKALLPPRYREATDAEAAAEPAGKGAA